MNWAEVIDVEDFVTAPLPEEFLEGRDADLQGALLASSFETYKATLDETQTVTLRARDDLYDPQQRPANAPHRNCEHRATRKHFPKPSRRRRASRSPAPEREVPPRPRPRSARPTSPAADRAEQAPSTPAPAKAPAPKAEPKPKPAPPPPKPPPPQPPDAEASSSAADRWLGGAEPAPQTEPTPKTMPKPPPSRTTNVIEVDLRTESEPDDDDYTSVQAGRAPPQQREAWQRLCDALLAHVTAFVGECNGVNTKYRDSLTKSLSGLDACREEGDQCHAVPVSDMLLVLCVTTFKRLFQLRRALPANLLNTLQRRDQVAWAIADFNPKAAPECSYQWMLENLSDACRFGHVFWFHAEEGWEHFDCPLAKNSAHVAGGIVSERLGFPENRVYLCNVDGDNIVTLEWLDHILAEARVCLDSLPSDPIDPAQPARMTHSGTHYVCEEMGTYGRIGLPLKTFRAIGGYDEDLHGMGVQDMDISQRLSWLGALTYLKSPIVGWSVPNLEDTVSQVLALSGASRLKHNKTRHNQGFSDFNRS